MSRGKRAEPAGKKVVSESIGSADTDGAGDCIRRSAEVSTDLEKFRFRPLRSGDEGFPCARHCTARRPPFNKLGPQLFLKGGELPRHCRMVHTQTPSRAENLACASDFQKDADTVPI